MLLSDFDFELPADRIAQTPTPDREAARLLVLDRDRGTVCHRTVADLPELLTPGDLLVVNDTRVFPARRLGRRVPPLARSFSTCARNGSSRSVAFPVRC